MKRHYRLLSLLLVILCSAMALAKPPAYLKKKPRLADTLQRWEKDADAVVKARIAELRTGDARAKGEAAMALTGMTGNRQGAILALIDALDDETAVPGVATPAEAATAALAAIGAPVVDPLLAALSHESPRVRAHALCTLGVLKDMRTLTAVTAALKDRDLLVNVAAVDALGAFAAPQSVPVLIAQLNRKEAPVRTAAVQVLADMKARAALPALLPLCNDPDAGVRLVTVRALAVFADPRAVIPLSVLLTDKELPVRRAALQALEGWQDPRLVPALLEVLKENDAEMRLLAVRQLGVLKDDRAVEPLIVRLSDADATVSGEAIRVLAPLCDPRAIRPLVELAQAGDTRATAALRDYTTPACLTAWLALMEDDDSGVRGEAIRVLTPLCDPRAIRPLLALKLAGDAPAARALESFTTPACLLTWVELLKDADAARRLAAIGTFTTIRDARAVDPLLAAVKEKDAALRAGAVRALVVQRDPRAVAPLITLLADANPDVCNAAVEGLTALGDARAITPLLTLSRTGEDGLRRKAVAALATLHDDHAVEAWTTLLTDKDAGVRLQALQALGASGNPRAAAPLLAIMKQGDIILCARAASALGQLRAPDAVDPLLVLLNDPTPYVRDAAAYALALSKDSRAVAPLQARLTDKTADPFAVTPIDRTLHEAAATGDLDGMRRCLAAGAEVNRADAAGLTPLHYAVIGEQADAAVLLLEKGANPDVRAGDGNTPLLLAAQRASQPLAEILLQHGADITPRDLQGRTALHWTAATGNDALGALLLHAGGNITETDRDGHTPLRLALDHKANALASAMLPLLTDPAQLIDVFEYAPSALNTEVKQRLVKQGEAATPALVAALGRGDAISMVSDTLVAIGKPAVPPLVAMWKSSQPGYQTRAGAVLARLQWTPTTIPDKCTWYFARQEWAKLRALGNAATPTLLYALKNGNAFERLKALSILAAQKDPRARAPLAALLKHPDPSTRFAVAKALYAAKWPPADPTTRARWLVMLGLWNEAARLGPPAIEPLKEKLRAPEYETRSAAAEALVSLVKRYPKNMSILTSLLKTRDVAGIAATYMFFIKLGRKGTEPILAQALYQYGETTMCEDYLNCGNRRLNSAGDKWAVDNGYRVNSTYGSYGGPRWGQGL